MQQADWKSADEVAEAIMKGEATYQLIVDLWSRVGELEKEVARRVANRLRLEQCGEGRPCVGGQAINDGQAGRPRAVSAGQGRTSAGGRWAHLRRAWRRE